MGPRGITAATAESAAHVPAYPQQGPLDPVGAGDAVLAALGCALASGASVADAALLGMLAASITVQQLGTTGTADPQSVRARFSDYARAFPALVEA